MSDEDDYECAQKKRVLQSSVLEEEDKNPSSIEHVPMEEDMPSPTFSVESPSNLNELAITEEVGNVSISNEYMELEEEMAKDKQALLDEFERRKKVRQMNVSTDDAEVKRNLRQLGQCICLFGEGPAERRIRLKNLLSRIGEDSVRRRKVEERERWQQEKEKENTWYHEGPPSLLQARIMIANYSLFKAKLRLKEAQEELSVLESTKTVRRQEVQKYCESLCIFSSQIGDSRPLSYCNFSNDSSMIATASWSGLCKVWSIPDCELMQTFSGHVGNVGAVVFHPEVTNTCEGDICSLASCSTDGSVKLWSLKSGTPIEEIDSHKPYRVSRIGFHPSGRYLGTCCFDNSWRLWDLQYKEEVLHQEGHCKPVYCLSFQRDGSLIATGGLDSFGRVWDLRTGRCVMFMEGHLKSIYAVDFSPNGYHLATGSEDHAAKIWDLRKRSCIYSIPAHMNIISDVKFQPDNGQFLVTASYDGKAKVWSDKTWQPLKTLCGHDGKVMSLDISSDGKYIATSSFDRTFKIWTPE